MISLSRSARSTAQQYPYSTPVLLKEHANPLGALRKPKYQGLAPRGSYSVGLQLDASNLHFQEAPRWFWCCGWTGHTLSSTVHTASLVRGSAGHGGAKPWMQGGVLPGKEDTAPASLWWLQGENHTMLPTLVISSPCPIPAAPTAIKLFSPGPSALEATVSTCPWHRSVAHRCPETLKNHPRFRRRGPSPEGGFICLCCLGPAGEECSWQYRSLPMLVPDFLRCLPSRELSACISSNIFPRNQTCECKTISTGDGTSLVSHLGPIPEGQTKKSNYGTRMESFHAWDLEISYSFGGFFIFRIATSSKSVCAAVLGCERKLVNSGNKARVQTWDMWSKLLMMPHSKNIWWTFPLLKWSLIFSSGFNPKRGLNFFPDRY